MAYLAYIVAGGVGLLFSYVGFVFAMISGRQFTYLIGGLLLAAHAGAIFYVVRRAKAGRGPQAAIVLVLPIFIVMILVQLFLAVESGISLLKPDSSAFTLACKTAGVRFYQLPTSPVHSIAYDWTGNNAPYNNFRVESGSRIASLGRSDFPHPDSIEFVERRRSNLEGAPMHGPDGPYIRFPKAGTYYAINDLTADVLVKYRIDPAQELDKAPKDQGLVNYEVTVTDRRTSEKLATLQFSIDAKNRRACGLTDEKAMNERSFVLRSIGIH